LLTSFWRASADFEPRQGQPEALLAWIFLQPQAEYLADHDGRISRPEALPFCPFCSGKPIVGVLRPEVDDEDSWRLHLLTVPGAAGHLADLPRRRWRHPPASRSTHPGR